MLKETEEREMLESKLIALITILKASERRYESYINDTEIVVAKALLLQEINDIANELRHDIKPLFDRLT